MMTKVAIALLLVAVVCVNSQNPGADNPWHFIHLRAKVTPNQKETPSFNKVIPAKVNKLSPGTKTVAGCGVPTPSLLVPHKDGRIVGGTEVVPHSYPWQAGLFINFIWFCGGSLINEEYILTAGHCCDGKSTATVILGAHNINQNEATQISITTTEIITHENYQPAVIHNDICLLHLPTTVSFNQYIMPVCLPGYSTATIAPGVIVTPTGWGLTSDSETQISDVLMEVDVPIYDHDACRAFYGIVNDGIICIDSSGDHGTCNGDSGGPLNFVNSQGLYETHGITSFGSSAGCDSGAPDAFTKVIYYLKWITDNSGIAIDP